MRILALILLLSLSLNAQLQNDWDATSILSNNVQGEGAHSFFGVPYQENKMP